MAEAERLCSTCKLFFCDNRKRMTHRLFESLIILRVNEWFCDGELVIQEIHQTRTERTLERYRDHQLQEEGLNEL